MHKISYKTLWKFFLPLWFSGFLQGFTLNLINSGLARMLNGATLLASFALARSLMQTVLSPMHMIRPTVTALTNNKTSYLKVRKFIALMTVSISLLLAIIAWTGLLKRFLIGVMRVDDVTTKSTVIIFKMIVFYPFGLLIKDFFIGVLIRFEKTYLGIVGSVGRTIYLFIIINQLHRLEFLPGEVVASLIFIFAPIVEGLILMLLIRMKVGVISENIPKDSKEEANIEVKEILIFYAPLALMAVINSVSKPLVNGGLTRFSDDIILLSAYAVGFGILMNLIFPLKLVLQLSVRYSHIDKKRVFRFSVVIGLLVSAIVSIIAFTPVGVFILSDLVGVDEIITNYSLVMAKIMIPLPIITVFREFFSGFLIEKRDTNIIGISKVIYLIILTISLLLYIKVLKLNPLVSASTAIVTAESIELFIILHNYIFKRRNKR